MLKSQKIFSNWISFIPDRLPNGVKCLSLPRGRSPWLQPLSTRILCTQSQKCLWQVDCLCCPPVGLGSCFEKGIRQWVVKMSPWHLREKLSYLHLTIIEAPFCWILFNSTHIARGSTLKLATILGVDNSGMKQCGSNSQGALTLVDL